MWSKLKQGLRSHAARMVSQLVNTIGDAFKTIRASDCRGYFRYCEYTLHLK